MRIVKTVNGNTRIGIPWGTFQRATGIDNIKEMMDVRVDVEIDSDYMITLTMSPSHGRYKLTRDYTEESGHVLNIQTIVRSINIKNNSLGTRDSLPFGPIRSDEVEFQMGDEIGAGMITFSLPVEVRPMVGIPSAPQSKRSPAQIKAALDAVALAATVEARPMGTAASPPIRPDRSPIHDEVVRQRARPGVGDLVNPNDDLSEIREAAATFNRCLREIVARYPKAEVNVTTVTDPAHGTVGSISATVSYKVA